MPRVRPRPVRVATVAALALFAAGLAGCFASHLPPGGWSAEDAAERLGIPPTSCGVLYLQGESKPYFERDLLESLRRTGIFIEVLRVPIEGEAATEEDLWTFDPPNSHREGWLLRFAERDTGDSFNRGRPFCLTGHVLTFGIIPDFWSEDDAWVYSLAEIDGPPIEPHLFAIEGERGGVIGWISIVMGLLPGWKWGSGESAIQERMAEHLATRVVQVVGERREGRPPISPGR